GAINDTRESYSSGSRNNRSCWPICRVGLRLPSSISRISWSRRLTNAPTQPRDGSRVMIADNVYELSDDSQVSDLTSSSVHSNPERGNHSTDVGDTDAGDGDYALTWRQTRQRHQLPQQRRPQDAPPPCGFSTAFIATGATAATSGDTYVDAAEVRKRKAARQNGQEGAAVAESSSANDTYVDVKEIQERKRRAKKRKESVEDVDPQEARVFPFGLEPSRTEYDSIARLARLACGKPVWSFQAKASDDRQTKADGLTYGQLDFSGHRASNVIIRMLPKTDYAQIQFEPPPRPPKQPRANKKHASE
ncbi:hypothetical protein BaRGS_00039394, partial [Batillaria attramentaria]